MTIQTGYPTKPILRGPTFRVSAGCDDAIVMLGHDEATCHECRREREREEALMRDEQTLDVQTSAD